MVPEAGSQIEPQQRAQGPVIGECTAQDPRGELRRGLRGTAHDPGFLSRLLQAEPGPHDRIGRFALLVERLQGKPDPRQQLLRLGLRLNRNQLCDMDRRRVEVPERRASGADSTNARTTPRGRRATTTSAKPTATMAQTPRCASSPGAGSSAGRSAQRSCAVVIAVVAVPPRCGNQRAPVKCEVPPIPAATITSTTSSTAKGRVRPDPVRAPARRAFRRSADTAPKLPEPSRAGVRRAAAAAAGTPRHRRRDEPPRARAPARRRRR